MWGTELILLSAKKKIQNNDSKWQTAKFRIQELLPFQFQIQLAKPYSWTRRFWIGMTGRELRLDMFYTDSYHMTSWNKAHKSYLFWSLIAMVTMKCLGKAVWIFIEKSPLCYMKNAAMWKWINKYMQQNITLTLICKSWVHLVFLSLSWQSEMYR